MKKIASSKKFFSKFCIHDRNIISFNKTSYQKNNYDNNIHKSHFIKFFANLLKNQKDLHLEKK